APVLKTTPRRSSSIGPRTAPDMRRATVARVSAATCILAAARGVGAAMKRPLLVLVAALSAGPLLTLAGCPEEPEARAPTPEPVESAPPPEPTPIVSAEPPPMPSATTPPPPPAPAVIVEDMTPSPDPKPLPTVRILAPGNEVSVGDPTKAKD